MRAFLDSQMAGQAELPVYSLTPKTKSAWLLRMPPHFLQQVSVFLQRNPIVFTTAKDAIQLPAEDGIFQQPGPRYQLVHVILLNQQHSQIVRNAADSTILSVLVGCTAVFTFAGVL